MIGTLHAVLLSLLLAAGAAPAEKRLQYLFIPDRQAASAGVQPVRFTAIVREQDVVLLAVLRDGTWLRYRAATDRPKCVTHEQYTLFARSAAQRLEVDTPLAGCDVPQPAPAAQAAPAAGPELASMFGGPISQIAGLNHYAKLLCGRAANFGCTPSVSTPYVARPVSVDCGFDAAHGEPCTNQ